MAANRAQHWTILLALVIGAVAGVAANEFCAGDEARRAALAWVSDWIAYPVGQVFLRLLFLVVVPLVFAALAASVARLGDLRTLGGMGFGAATFFLLTTAFSVALGLLAMHVVAPGEGFDPAMRGELMQAFAAEAAKAAASSTATAISVAVLPFAVVIIVRIGRRLRRISKATQQTMGRINTVLQESFTGQRIVKAFATHPGYFDAVTSCNANFKQSGPAARRFCPASPRRPAAAQLPAPGPPGPNTPPTSAGSAPRCGSRCSRSSSARRSSRR